MGGSYPLVIVLVNGKMTILWILICVIHCAVAHKLQLLQQLSPTVEEVHICSAFKLDDDTTYHINNIHPVISDPAIHHLIMGACTKPGSDQPYWNCMDKPFELPSEPGLPKSTICDNQHVFPLYGRLDETGDLSLPGQYAFEVGKDTKYKYVVLQIHYANLKAGQMHNSGVEITYDTGKKSNTTTIMFDIENNNVSNVLPPHQKTIVEAFRVFPVMVNPISYCVHTHGLGVNVSVWAVKKRSTEDGLDTWIKLGKRDPRLPQDYVPVENHVTVLPGDAIVTRCTYYNTRDEASVIGPKTMDDMCDVFLLSWCHSGEEELVYDKMYDKDNYQMMHWNDIGLNNIPNDA